MKSAIEYFLSIIILTVAVFLLVSYNAASIDSSNARDFHASVVEEIEAANFSPLVIDACKEEAGKRGYTLEVSAPTGLKNNQKIAEVTLAYHYSVKLLNLVDNKHEIRGFAR